MITEQKLSRGERKIRPDFSKNDEVKEIKRLYTFLYDKIDGILTRTYADGPHTDKHFDIIEACKRSLDDLETSCMYAVKALTV